MLLINCAINEACYLFLSTPIIVVCQAVSGEYYGLIVGTKKSSSKAFYAKSPANYAKGNVS